MVQYLQINVIHHIKKLKGKNQMITSINAEKRHLKNSTSIHYKNSQETGYKGKFIAIQSYLKKQEKSQTNSLTLHLKQLEKEEQKNPKVSRRKEIIKSDQK